MNTTDKLAFSASFSCENFASGKFARVHPEHDDAVERSALRNGTKDPNNSNYKRVVGRYFPLFWSGSTNWMAVDLRQSANNRMVIIDPDLDEIVNEIYGSFEEFLKDAVRANEQDRALHCFH